MHKNAVPPRTEAPSSDSSEEETGRSDEETEDEEQAEGVSGFESGSDQSTDTTKRKSDIKAAAPASARDLPGKRTRQSIGKEDELPAKKSKPEVTNPASRAASKAVAKQSVKKRATKPRKSKSTPPGKEKPSTAEKKSVSKRKTATSAPKTSLSSRSADKTSQKSKVPSQPWSPEEELALSREIQKDRVNDLYGPSLPSARADPYWGKLMIRLSFLDKYETEQRIERLCEKIRRMRLRYESLITRMRAGEENVAKNSHESLLWRIWHTIWGPMKATPEMLEGLDFEGVFEEEEYGSGPKGSEEEDEEDDEEETVPAQVEGRQDPLGRTPANRKLIGKEVVVLDGNSSDESPVKATPPPGAAASAETSRAGKQAPVLKSLPTEVTAVSAMDVDSGRFTSRVAVQNGAQGGHAVITEMREKSLRAGPVLKGSDEVRAENLALLRDMRGTCVRMVEEAKAQSLDVTEKILEATRLKTTEIVEEARLKSSMIMEELRLVIERFGTFAGHSGQTNGSVGGRCDIYDNPYQGLKLGNGNLHLRDPSNVKWLQQSEEEQGLHIQWLQLVQDNARIQQQRYRVELETQKQQVSAQSKQA